MLVALAWWEDRIVAGIARFAASHGWTLDCSLRLTQKLPKANRWEGDGVIAYTGVAQTCEPLAEYVSRCAVPVVCLDSDQNIFNSPSVVVGHEAVGAMAAEHLLSLHFEHFAFVEFDDNPMELLRRRGFELAILAAGKTFHPFTREEFGECLHGLPRPMGIMASNDVNAMDVVSACTAGGARVPEDFAVVGVDNSEVSSRISPIPLTSIECDFERQGYEAAVLLHQQMEGSEMLSTKVVIAPCGVRVRRSTETLAVSDEETALALRLLRQRFREPIRLKELTDVLGGRLRHVQTRFRMETGRTMAQELMRLRIEHAKKLLRDSAKRINEIAYESGFASRFHFYEAFRRVTGCTPTAFRSAIRSAAGPDTDGKIDAAQIRSGRNVDGTRAA
ncbi:MAG: substrate-binding domain-containing protein [Opitutaceae bacterium]